MDAERFAERAKICRNKIKYMTRQLAKRRAKEDSAIYGKKLDPYRCLVCGSFHLRTRRQTLK